MTVTDENTFELSFAEMAIAALRSASPALIDYMLGFQLVEKEDDGTKAVGFFAFKTGEEYIYVPIFFLKGEIHGTEMMYVRGQDRFLPLEEGWVDYIIQKKPIRLGDQQEQATNERSNEPDLRVMYEPPNEKGASDLDKALAHEFASTMSSEKWASWATPVRDTMTGFFATVKQAASDLDIALPTVLARHGLTEKFAKQMLSDPKLASSFCEFYDFNDLVAAVDNTQRLTKTPKTAAPQVYKDAPMILTQDSLIADKTVTPMLSDEEKRVLLRGEAVVLDNRKDDQARKIYDVSTTTVLSNPTGPGLYDMLSDSGDIVQVLILQPHPLGAGTSHGARLIVDPVNKLYRLSLTETIWVTQRYEDEDFRDAMANIGQAVTPEAFKTDKEQAEDGVHPAVNSLDTADNTGQGTYPDQGGEDDAESNYIIVAGDGKGLMPFDVSNKIERADGQTALFVTPVHAFELNVQPSRFTSEPAYQIGGRTHGLDDAIVTRNNGSVIIHNDGTSKTTGVNARQSQILLTDKPIRHINTSHSTVIVPMGEQANVRVFRLRQAGPGQIDTGALADMHLAIGKFAEDLVVRCDRTTYAINGTQGLSKLAALRSLVDRGVHGKVAQELVADQPVSRWERKVLIERADLYQKRADAFDTVDNGGIGFDQWAGVPTQESQVNSSRPDEYRTETDPSAYANIPQDPDYTNLQGGDLEAMQQASDTGQKDVFDASALGALIRMDNVADEIDSYLGTLINSLDRLGRLLFLTYWHYDQIQERYGQSESSVILDDLKSVFSSLGELVLTLRRRSVNEDDLIGRGLLDSMDPNN